ncbi:MAG TPA: F0F1 ATP synthase subunit delta [Kiloniellales bacterium]|nr:F0F1 ATP synthase subunit delta [Kiloniellales bacterium]
MAGEDTSTGSLAGRYALALFELADEGQALDRVADDLKGVDRLLAESEDLQRLVSSPLYGREEQSKAMEVILERAGVSDLTRRFILVVAQNRRLFALPKMIRAFLAELARRRGEVRAEVTAASLLNEAQERALLETLSKSVGGKVQLEVKTDPSLLGGLVVKVGSRMIDTSLRNKLQRLQFAMKGVG